MPGLPSPYVFSPKVSAVTLVATLKDWNARVSLCDTKIERLNFLFQGARPSDVYKHESPVENSHLPLELLTLTILDCVEYSHATVGHRNPLW